MTFAPIPGWTCVFLLALAAALIVCKLAGCLTWSWWLVLSPLAPVLIIALLAAYSAWLWFAEGEL